MRVTGFATESLRSDPMIHETFPVKELQDYWATRSRYEERGAAVDEAPPPPYRLEDEQHTESSNERCIQCQAIPIWSHQAHPRFFIQCLSLFYVPAACSSQEFIADHWVLAPQAPNQSAPMWTGIGGEDGFNLAGRALDTLGGITRRDAKSESSPEQVQMILAS
ncbi:uncharacterized protein BJ212DRAFT_1514974 [Suillus subaureus]|uniref:Uncharacterized protein n=1 Tax=Suillus subaureus TaxID=48587 RepID=A0A9P7E834_9AGAM|nr:uncharacterized protein BJ212DRAFT_1514974 [Suillus subaureus]KAG1814022.1 hypothetical protein BJ212DRAFT_1514974 [Suillus subaureus]